VTSDPIEHLRERLPRHWRLLDALRSVVEADDRLRWLELGCSLGAGGGDELSDADVGIGYTDIPAPAELEAIALTVADSVGSPIDVIVHRMDGWPENVCRVAAEYADGVELDLVFMPADHRIGLPERTIAIVDKDGRLATSYESPSGRPPSPYVARQWVFLGWWALSAAHKYAVRESWFEAVEALAEARKNMLSLFACGNAVRYPSFGLVSLLDYPPFELPDRLAEAYCTPADPPAVIAALRACGELLRDATERAARQLGADVDSAMAGATMRRLARL
jgi:hypothetical protein